MEPEVEMVIGVDSADSDLVMSCSSASCFGTATSTNLPPPHPTHHPHTHSQPQKKTFCVCIVEIKIKIHTSWNSANYTVQLIVIVALGNIDCVLYKVLYGGWCYQLWFELLRIFILPFFYLRAGFQKNSTDEASEQFLAALKAEKEELEATLNREQLQTVQLKEDIAQAESRNVELTKARHLSSMS